MYIDSDRRRCNIIDYILILNGSLTRFDNIEALNNRMEYEGIKYCQADCYFAGGHLFVDCD